MVIRAQVKGWMDDDLTLKFFINFCARRYCAPAYFRFIFFIKSAHYTRENTVVSQTEENNDRSHSARLRQAGTL